jgi:hypothetical protein
VKFCCFVDISIEAIVVFTVFVCMIHGLCLDSVATFV